MVMSERDERPANRRRSPLPAADPAAGDRPRRRSVLVVDDDQQLLTQAVRSLRAHGHDVRGAASGREALLALYGGGPVPALLVTDVDMPGMTGIELVGKLRQRRIDSPAILIASQVSDELYGRAALSGFRTVLEKPLHDSELLDSIHAALT